MASPGNLAGGGSEAQSTAPPSGEVDQLDLLQAIFDASPDPTAAYGPTWHCVAINQAYRKAFPAIIGTPIGKGDLLPEALRVRPDVLEALRDYQGRVAVDPEACVDLEYWDKSGKNCWEFHVSPLKNRAGQRIGTLHTGRDVTARARAEQALREQKSLLESVVNSLGEAVIAADQTGRFLLFNPAARQLHEKPGLEVPPSDWPSTYGLCLADGETPCPPDLVPLARALRGEAIDGFSMAIRDRTDGAPIWIDVTARPLRGDDGNPTGGVVVFRDVTRSHQYEADLRHRERDLREAQRLASLGSWSWEPETDTILWSEELFRIWGLPPAERGPRFVNQQALYEPASWNRLASLVTMAVQEGRPYEAHLRILRADGTKRWLLARGEAVRDASGRIVGLRGTAQDVTAQREAEIRLAQSAAELERSNRDLQQFAHVASHDLQEPLRMVASFLQLLERRYRGQLDPTAHEFIGFAVDGARRMQQLLDALLEYSRVEVGALPEEPAPTEEVLDGVLRDLQLPMAECGAQVTRGSLPPAWIAPAQLARLFQNLISNALKFRRGAPHIQIRAQTDAEGTTFAIEDDGIGVEAGQEERIFLPFQRLHARDSYPGSGMGLAICKRILEPYQGDLWVESSPGAGSTFFFSVPFPASTSSTAGPAVRRARTETDHSR